MGHCGRSLNQSGAGVEVVLGCGRVGHFFFNRNDIGSTTFADDGLKHEILVPEFGGPSPGGSAASYVTISRTFQVGHNLDLEVWFLSRSSDGILAYAAQDANGRGDFIWLALIGGRVQFRWDLGSGAGIVTYVALCRPSHSSLFSIL